MKVSRQVFAPSSQGSQTGSRPNFWWVAKLTSWYGKCIKPLGNKNRAVCAHLLACRQTCLGPLQKAGWGEHNAVRMVQIQWTQAPAKSWEGKMSWFLWKAKLSCFYLWIGECASAFIQVKGNIRPPEWCCSSESGYPQILQKVVSPSP